MAKEKKADSRDKQRVTTPEFRVSFPHVFKPSSIKGSEPKYSVTMLFKKSQDLTSLKNAMKFAKIEAFGEDKKNWPDDLETPVTDGDDFPDREGYPGHWVIKATSNAEYKPSVVDEDVEEIMEAGTFYPGCYARAQVYARVWTFGKKKGVHFILDMVQKVKDGKPFGGKKAAKEVFSPIDREESESEDGDNGDDDF